MRDPTGRSSDFDEPGPSNGNEPAKMKKRSVVIAGHRTSVSLENSFWTALKEIAASRHLTVNQLVTEIDRRRVGNLSSAIRVFVLQTFRNAGR